MDIGGDTGGATGGEGIAEGESATCGPDGEGSGDAVSASNVSATPAAPFELTGVGFTGFTYFTKASMGPRTDFMADAECDDCDISPYHVGTDAEIKIKPTRN